MTATALTEIEKKPMGRRPKKDKTAQIRAYQSQVEMINDIATASGEDISDLVEPYLDHLIRDRYPEVLKKMKKTAEERAERYSEWKQEKKVRGQSEPPATEK